jgi:hypothetical protein
LITPDLFDPLLNLSIRWLEKAIATTRRSRYTQIQYARFR